MKLLPVLALSITTGFLFSGCVKENIKPHQASTASVNNATAANADRFLGTYSVIDSKTIFQGQANPRGTNVFIHLDYIAVPKILSKTADRKHLTMPYGPSNYVDSGWAYIIDYNAKTGVVTLAPNAAMINDIVAGSFETRLATYNPQTMEGNFVTRFTALSDKGNETEISEYLSK